MLCSSWEGSLGPPKEAAWSFNPGAFGHSIPSACNVFLFFFLHPWPYFTWLNIYSFQTVFWVIIPSDVLLSLPDAGSSILSLLTFLHLWVYVVWISLMVNLSSWSRFVTARCLSWPSLCHGSAIKGLQRRLRGGCGGSPAPHSRL